MLETSSGVYDPGIRSGQLELINVTEDQLAIRRTLNLEQQGCLTRTNIPTEFAVSGKGYFLLRNPTNGELRVTRFGSFHLDAVGYLVTTNGQRVQGFSDAALMTRGDGRVDEAGRPPFSEPSATLNSFSFTGDDKLIIALSDGTQFVRGQILLQYFGEPYRLVADESRVFTNMSQACPWPEAVAPGYSGLGSVLSGAYEPPPIVPNLLLPSRNAFRLRITAEPGMRWLIQATTNFVDWSELGGFTNTPEEAEFCDELTMPQPQRFYRVVVFPP